MNEIIVDELTHDGMRRVKVIADNADDFPRVCGVVPGIARDKMQTNNSHDDALGIFSMNLTWPVFGPYDFFIYGPKKFRRLMVVNYEYAERVSDCIELARIMFFAGTHFAPKYVFVAELPKGAEDCMDVHGCILLQAEWMPARCVAVGGYDG
jgi:hypothetical protein